MSLETASGTASGSRMPPFGGGTGEDETRVSFSKPTVTGPSHASSLSTWNAPARGLRAQTVDAGGQTEQPAPPSLGHHARVFRGWMRCADAAAEALANAGDPVERANNLYEFRQCLALLWDEREHREETYAVLVNKLQLIVKGVDLSAVPETALLALERVAREAARECPLAGVTLRRFTVMLDKAGLDLLDHL